MAVGDVEKAQRTDRHVKIERITSLRITPSATPRRQMLRSFSIADLEHVLRQRRDIRPAVDVLDHDEANEVFILVVVIEGELDQLGQRLQRRQFPGLPCFRPTGSGGSGPPGRRDRAAPCRRNNNRSSASRCGCARRSRRSWRHSDAFSENSWVATEISALVRSGSLLRVRGPRFPPHPTRPMPDAPSPHAPRLLSTDLRLG